jgi:hypothetical protein
MTLARQMSKLCHTKVQIMILTMSAHNVSAHIRSTMTHTHSHTRYVNSSFVQEGYHMATLRDGALKARVEGITGEEGDNVRLIGKSRVRAVIVHEGLEAGGATDGLC